MSEEENAYQYYIYANKAGYKARGTEDDRLEGVEGFGRIELGSTTCGLISWRTGKGIDHIEVDPPLRRTGLATELFKQAQKVDPTIKLRGDWSRDGLAWMQSFNK